MGENNSEDLTFDKIRRYSEKSEVVKFLDTTFIEKFDDRILRLSKARQHLIYTFMNKILPKYIFV